MSARLPRLVVLVALLLAALPAVAGAALSKDVRRVIADYREDGTIEPCAHSAKAYADALEAVEADAERYAADLPVAVEAARDARKGEDCTAASDEDEDTGDDGAAGGTGADPTPTPTPSPAPAPVTPAPAPAPTPDEQAPPSPTVEGLPDSSSASPTPAPPTQEVVPDPPAPAGSGAGITPGTPPAGTSRPDVALERTASGEGSGSAPVPVIVLGALVLAAGLAALVALASRRFGWGERRLAGVRHAMGEASYRTGGTWQSFTDWLRLGR